MKSVQQQLHDFIEALSQPEAAAALFGRHAAGASAYANNLLFNRADALADSYPVVQQLVGEEFFGGMARLYARQTPSHSGDIHRYGSDFADFIAGFAPAAELPYLADAARLDWLCHRAYFADDGRRFDLARLADVAPERQGALCLQLDPAVGLLASSWPIASLWRAHLAEDDADHEAFPSPDQGGEWALCWRNRHNKVRVRRLSQSSFAFLQACANGHCLAEALECALDADMEFDLGASLHGWITDQVIADFNESPQ
ncbi:putative DNA-binding domain-containing protein [Chitinimonas sp.]|uniref:HvfC/BufC family peptide modification chaperone n=1 Tax=Chitinimonas sp. TaxID=1934313 RepID=UPI0035B298EB